MITSLQMSHQMTICPSDAEAGEAPAGACPLPPLKMSGRHRGTSACPSQAQPTCHIGIRAHKHLRTSILQMRPWIVACLRELPTWRPCKMMLLMAQLQPQLLQHHPSRTHRAPRLAACPAQPKMIIVLLSTPLQRLRLVHQTR